MAIDLTETTPTKRPKPPHPAQTRLSVLLAREGDKAVVFRRGPTRQVLLIRWHRDTDTFDLGQWFRGRIYEHRCDLSPDGERLLYFAAKYIGPHYAGSSNEPPYREPYYAWTAISRPPFLTALALWPKGDCWGGGGEYVTDNHIRLNHGDSERTLADGYELPKTIKVEPYGEHSGHGEDDPVHTDRRVRDGWSLRQQGGFSDYRGGKLAWVVSPPEILSKPNPAHPGLVLLSSLHGLHERDGPWRVVTHAVERDGDIVLDLGRSDWADWDRNGDLLYAQDGQLFRCVRDGDALLPAHCLIDTREMRFRRFLATPEATTW